MMITADRERIEIDLPTDVLFAMRGIGKPEIVRKKLKVALAVFLFQEETISLGKATELAEMSRVQFIELLQSYGIAAYEYSERDFGQDMEAVNTYRQAVQAVKP
jgi:predicted HTH domain antitoxin